MAYVLTSPSGNVKKSVASAMQKDALVARGYTLTAGGSADVTDSAYIAAMVDSVFAGWGITGDSGNLCAYAIADSKNITTKAQIDAIKTLDPLESTAYASVSFVTKLPLLSAATVKCVYVDALGNMVVKPASNSTSFTVLGGKIPVPDSRLASLLIGALTLTPTFNSNVGTYTAATTNATDAITAVANDTDATVVIKNGETTVTNGAAATWIAGSNTVTVTVTIGIEVSTYTVTVTKS